MNITGVYVSILSGARILHDHEVVDRAQHGDAKCMSAIGSGERIIVQESDDKKMIMVQFVNNSGGHDSKEFECRTGIVPSRYDFNSDAEFMNALEIC
jgi:hypothetical protein